MLNVDHVRQKYKDRMLQLAFVVSGWSPEPEGRRHGCILAVDGKYIVATGFNGPDRHWRAEGAVIPDCGGDCCQAPTIHAEANAIMNAEQIGVDLSRCVAYVTKKPCDECNRALEARGILACFWLQDLSTQGAMWTR